MLTKLAIKGIKTRWRDYLVLFSGLTIAASIFYMFEALATNKAFLATNSVVSATAVIFQFGSVLLGIITLVYVLYANSFLMNMRKHDYGLFMMLGAKSGKIGWLMFLETFMIGIGSTILGILIGIGLTSVVSGLLINQLDLKINHLVAFYLPAVLTTLIFFGILFVIAAIVNQARLSKKPILELLHEDNQPNVLVNHPVRYALESIAGIALLAIGYYVMIDLKTFQLLAIPIALVTIVMGTYLLFNAVFIWLLLAIQRSQKVKYHHLNNFTIAQLGFRIKSYTKILSMVTLLFALALGAITVGIGYQSEIPEFAKNITPYTLDVQQPTAKDNQAIKKLTGSTSQTYAYKLRDNTIYFSKQALADQPVYTVKPKTEITMKSVKLSMTDLQKMPQYYLVGFVRPEWRKKTIKIVDENTYQNIDSAANTVKMVRVDDINKNQATLKQIQNQQTKKYGSVEAGNDQYENYLSIKTVFGGMEFMGLFLGFAFLAMLASCLMFKILSGANQDQTRYQMLQKLGTHRSWLKNSINTEIGVLFALPAILGMIHVLFGLQLFRMIMINPYQDLWIPFTGFLVLYGIYYWITTAIYQKLVLSK